MDKCCTGRLEPRPQRRLNGLQLPLNYQQVLGWIVLVTTALLNLIVLTEVQFYELKVASLGIYVILYVWHVGSHAKALLTDPSERELRKLKVNNVPEFDRSIHAHVIENGRCHLCNIYTTSRRTKHCSLCNKCVDRFDHHCKWLNNCVGHRNYSAFITSVITALLISLYTSSLCITDIVLFLTYPEQLSPVAQNFINCTLLDTPQVTKYCRNSISFLTFLVIFFVIAIAIACALLHLCCFHVYISILGVSTYEYIVRSSRFKMLPSYNTPILRCCTNKFGRRWYRVNDNQTIKSTPENGAQTVNANSVGTNDTNSGNVTCSNINNEGVEGNKLFSLLLANEFDKAKNIFLYNNKNRIHPHNDIAS